MKRDMTTNRSAIAELADKCGITEAQATEAIDLLLDGDGRQYRRLVSDRLHAVRRAAVRADGPTPERLRALDGIRETVRRMTGAKSVSIVLTY